MEKYYSSNLEEGTKLLYFQCDPAKYEEGIQLIQKAADENEADAYYFLARLYFWEEYGREEDINEGIRLSEIGISLGSQLCVLGAVRAFAYKSETLEQDLINACEDVTMQAEAGNPCAQYAIGNFYYWGDVNLINEMYTGRTNAKKRQQLGIKNTQEALRWFKMGASQGHILCFKNAYSLLTKGNEYVSHIIQEGLKLAEDVRPYMNFPMQLVRQIGDDYEKIGRIIDQRRWYQYGIENGDPDCFNRMGLSYQDEKNYNKAWEYYQAGLDIGDGYCAYNIGCILYYGRGFKENEAEAFTYFEKAAELGINGAEYYLALYYDTGKAGIEKDENKFIYWAKKAEQDGSRGGKILMAKAYTYGIGVPADYEAARNRCWEIINTGGDSRVWFYLAVLAENGWGCPVDYNLAVEYYNNALTNGYKPAREELLRFRKKFGLFGDWVLK